MAAILQLNTLILFSNQKLKKKKKGKGDTCFLFYFFKTSIVQIMPCRHLSENLNQALSRLYKQTNITLTETASTMLS